VRSIIRTNSCIGVSSTARARGEVPGVFRGVPYMLLDFNLAVVDDDLYTASLINELADLVARRGAANVYSEFELSIQFEV
jgi:hypothetical protein